MQLNIYPENGHGWHTISESGLEESVQTPVEFAVQADLIITHKSKPVGMLGIVISEDHEFSNQAVLLVGRIDGGYPGVKECEVANISHNVFISKGVIAFRDVDSHVDCGFVGFQGSGIRGFCCIPAMLIIEILQSGLPMRLL